MDLSKIKDKISKWEQNLQGAGPLSADKSQTNEADMIDPVVSDDDKKAVVAKAMGMASGGLVDRLENSPIGQAASALFDPVGTAVNAATAAAPQILRTEAPIAQRAASVATDGAVPAPAAPVQAAPAPMPQAAPVAPAPVQAAPQPKPVAQGKPDPVDLMSRITNNDSDTMNALLDHLKDSDRRGNFAQALAVIGDTLGNMGNAKAGMTPQGFTSTKLVTDQNAVNRGRIQDDTKARIAADPNSQTSHMAQTALLQAMNIPQNDPRAKQIMAMPASTIISTMPQLTDGVKLQLERESNALQGKIAENTAGFQKAQMSNDAARLKNEETNTATTQQNDALERDIDIRKNNSPLNPFNAGIRDAATTDLTNRLTNTSQAHPQDAAAVNWAHTHPNDPRSKKILQVNGL